MISDKFTVAAAAFTCSACWTLVALKVLSPDIQSNVLPAWMYWGIAMAEAVVGTLMWHRKARVWAAKVGVVMFSGIVIVSWIWPTPGCKCLGGIAWLERHKDLVAATMAMLCAVVAGSPGAGESRKALGGTDEQEQMA